jgi:hypothetical protein
MRRKRFNHYGDAIIGILTGYQVVMDSKYFKKYGHGLYVMDLLTGYFTFNGKTEEKFPVFFNIQNWFDNEIKKASVDVNFIKEAKIILKVAEPHQEKQIIIEKRSLFFFKKKIAIDYYSYKTDVNFVFLTDEKDYSKAGEGVIWA